jgi:glycosyltransferase involved in cell wall biosynthesis
VIRFYLPHLGQSGGVQHVLKIASGLFQRGQQVSVIDLSERCVSPAWFGDPLPPPEAFSMKDADAHVMPGDGPGHLLRNLAGKKHCFFMNLGVWNQDDERWNMQHDWDGVWACASWMRELLPFKNVALIPPGIDARLFAEEQVEREPHTVGVLLHHAPFKGGELALRSVDSLPYTDKKLLCYGPATTNALFVEHAGRPTYEELRRLYRRCSIWLMPSLAEGFPLPPVEAAVCGAAPLYLDTGRQYDFMPHKARAVEFGSKLQEMLEKPPETSAVAAKYTWENTVNAAVKALEE